MIASTRITEQPEFSEITGAQTVSVSYGDNTLSRDSSKFGTFADYRLLRKDATVALGRGLLISGILAGAWSVESDEDVAEEVTEFITATVLPLREQVMRASVAFGRCDFGFMPFEKIFMIKDGRLILSRLKPLLHDITTILIDVHGNFLGYKQSSVNVAMPVYIPAEKCLLINFEVEGGNLYGYPLLENIRAIQTMWHESNDGARRYDKKIAGSMLLVKYPRGTVQIDGETVDNADLAVQTGDALKSSGFATVPQTVANNVQEFSGDDKVAQSYEWEISIISDMSPRQSTFIDRLKYLDSLKIRGIILPERSMLEGQFGTKAEAGEHIGLAITNMQEIDTSITQMTNVQVVDQLLALNWGEGMIGKVRLVATPLVDLQVAFLRDLYLALVKKNYDLDAINTEALKTSLNIPIQKEELVAPVKVV